MVTRPVMGVRLDHTTRPDASTIWTMHGSAGSRRSANWPLLGLGTTRGEDACVQVTPRTADGLTRLTLGLFRDRAGVDDDRVVQPRGSGMRLHHLGFIGVEAAAKGQNLRVF